MLGIRIKYYQMKGWVLLDREVRTKAPWKDCGGIWDAWMSDGQSWLFIQVGSHAHRSEKIKECKEWIDSYGLFHPYDRIKYRVDTYQGPHWSGRGKSKVWVPKTAWQSDNMEDYL